MTGLEGLITGAAISAGAMVAQRISMAIPARRRRAKPIAPVCGCEHHRSFHEDGTGPCHHMNYAGYEETADAYRRVHVQCGCRAYSGPVPLPEYFAPELTGETDA